MAKNRIKNIQKDSEKKLSEIYNILSDETIIEPQVDEDGKVVEDDMNNRIIKNALVEFAQINTRDSSLERKDKNGEALEPDIVIDGDTMKINEYNVEILPPPEILKLKNRQTPYDIVGVEYEYMVSLLTQLNYVKKIADANTRVPKTTDTSLVSNLQMAKLLALRNEEIKRLIFSVSNGTYSLRRTNSKH